jgi:hypothetical protein
MYGLLYKFVPQSLLLPLDDTDSLHGSIDTQALLTCCLLPNHTMAMAMLLLC